MKPQKKTWFVFVRQRGYSKTQQKTKNNPRLIQGVNHYFAFLLS